MLQIDAAAVRAMSLVCDNNPKQAWQRQKKQQCLMAGNYFWVISTILMNIVVLCTLRAGNEMFSTPKISQSAILCTVEILSLLCL